MRILLVRQTHAARSVIGVEQSGELLAEPLPLGAEVVVMNPAGARSAPVRVVDE
jgi:hypothetical protein